MQLTLLIKDRFQQVSLVVLPPLARCLDSVKDADEIIICDTGSTDNTIEIAKKYTDKVYTDFTWCDDFSAARNHAKEKATGDYILSIDADEFCHDFSKVRESVEAILVNIFGGIMRCDVIAGGEYEVTELGIKD